MLTKFDVFEGKYANRAGVRKAVPRRRASRSRRGSSREELLQVIRLGVAVAANARRKAQGKSASVISPSALEESGASTRCSISSARSTARAPNGGGSPSGSKRAAGRRSRTLAPRRTAHGNDLAKAMDYLLKHWPAFTRFLDDGRICLSNNTSRERFAV